MNYTDHIIISMVPRRGNGFDMKQFRAVYAEKDGLYADCVGYGPSAEIAMAQLHLAQIEDLLESMNLKGADDSE